MKNLQGALMFAQSGGPTSVINASAAGVFIEGLKSPSIFLCQDQPELKSG